MYVAESISDLNNLATRMVALEEEAFKQFAHIFGPRLRAFFIRRGLAESDAEDLAGSCVTDIALKVRHYRLITEGSFGAWVFTLARHALADWRKVHVPTEPLSDDLATESDPNDDESELSVILAVEEALAKLSDLDRSLIRLRILKEDKTYTAFLEQSGMSTGAARVRHFRALRRLKDTLEADPRIKEYLSERTSE